MNLPTDPTTFCDECGCHDNMPAGDDCGGGCQNWQCGCARQPAHHQMRVERMRAFLAEHRVEVPR